MLKETIHTSLVSDKSSSIILTNVETAEEGAEEEKEKVEPGTVIVSIKHDKSTSTHSMLMMKENDQSDRFIYFEMNRSRATPSNRLRQHQDRLTHSHTFYPHPFLPSRGRFKSDSMRFAQESDDQCLIVSDRVCAIND